MFLILQQSHFYGITTEMQSSCFLNLPSSAGFMTFWCWYPNKMQKPSEIIHLQIISKPSSIFTQILEADGLGGISLPIDQSIREYTRKKIAILNSPK